MNKNYPFAEFQNLINQSQSISIFLSDTPKFDQAAAALALKLTLEKGGKAVSVLSAASMRVEFNHLIGIDTVTAKNNVGKDLVISLNYPLDQIEKVSYNDEGGKLNLVVQSKEGAPRVEKEQINFNYQGGKNGLQIALGVESPSRLGPIADQMDTQNLINIDNSSTNNQFGRLNIVDTAASCCSEMMVAIIASLTLATDEDIANNLFLGLEEATLKFSSASVSADAFEAAAVCLRWGAKRSVGFTPPPKPIFEEKPRPVPPRPQFTKPRPTNNPSPDWLAPKIYRSSNV